eukprot:gnl/MRDRNA2_/MRDRNA2_87421_c0_seq1.p1 gnl/MRDRNA2_/MRDRNA2_87421_c0~~gnl/MRDRNA2_/MRDRNA2_87421_c0_seq1.p1  ORF type:complete len:316 (-),score=58.25 gnl/MRDRNA2_/MRDRNA2_87421_c0_seq1:410-1357(-)
MEVALIPGVLALGESIACQLGCAAAEYEANTSRSRQSGTARSHPGIYSSNNSNMNPTRTHCGIYCNPAAQRSLQPLAENQSYDGDISTSISLNDAYTPPLSSRSSCESEVDSPCPTARLALPNKFCTELAGDGCDPAHSPSTRDLLAPTEEKLCPARSESPFGMASPTGEFLAKTQRTSTKITAASGYLLSFEDFPVKKDVISGSNSTASTCSELDISSGTLSAASSSSSNASDRSEEVASPRSEILTRMPVGATPIDQTIVVAPAAPVSKARSFCQKAFADCGLDNMDDELADLTKDLETLRASMAKSKRVVHA